MSKYFGINSDNSESTLVTFLNRAGFIFKKKEELYNFKKKFIFIIDVKTTLNSSEEAKAILSKLKNISFLFLPPEFKKYYNGLFFKSIYYPININNFKIILKDIRNFPNIFFDIDISKNNFIRNTVNNKIIYLTESEFSILKCLLNDKIVEKEKLKTEILKFHVSLETKSLESHLSRIRKKLQKIHSKILITSVNANQINVS